MFTKHFGADEFVFWRPEMLDMRIRGFMSNHLRGSVFLKIHGQLSGPPFFE